MVTYTYNHSSTQESEAGGSQVQGWHLPYVGPLERSPSFLVELVRNLVQSMCVCVAGVAVVMW